MQISPTLLAGAALSLIAPLLATRAPLLDETDEPTPTLKVDEPKEPIAAEEGESGDGSMAPMKRPPRKLSRDGVMFVVTDDPKHPRVRYADGQVSLNDSCAVLRGNKLNRRMPPAYVNGQPLGFC